MLNHQQLSQAGNVSIIVVVMVAMVGLLLAGLMGLSEWNMAHSRVRLAAQASANSGAFTYGKTWVTEMKTCIKTQIEEMMTDDPDELLTACVADGLQACLDSEFASCQVDLDTCWEPEDSPITLCEGDETVKQVARDQADGAARRIAGSYAGIVVDSSQPSHESFTIKVHLDHQSLIPVWGKSGRIEAEAKSSVVIRE